MAMTAYICVTCGTQFARSANPPAECSICLDERQYVGHDGQAWTTLDQLRQEHETRIEEVEPGLVGIGIEPKFAIGQRALIVENVLWDCIPLIDETIAGAVEERGGVATIAISHPHYYSAMVEWAERLEARILLHEADKEWVMRPSDRIVFWSGDRHEISPTLELHRLGGHFPGGTVVLWRDSADGRGALLSGDIIQVVSDRDWVSFMWSYPNLIPLPAAEVQRIAAHAATLEFDRLYGAWWDSVVEQDAKAKVAASAARYVDALARYRGLRRQVEAYVFVDTENPGPKRVVQKIRRLDGVLRADALLGTPDIVAIVQGDDIAAMDAVIDRIAELDGVLDTESKVARWID
jgi:hypothetical protein